MRVFVSSTSEDLEPYRAAAREVILELGAMPVMMEHFGTGGTAGIVEACSRRLEDCEAVLAIIAWRRGGVPPPEQGGDGKASYTAWELNAAYRHRKPVVVLIARDTWPGKLWERDAGARAWVEDFRGTLNRLAVFFDWEPVEAGAREPLPNFRAKVREELLRQRHGELEKDASRLPGVQLHIWPAPELPERPYPLLLHYTHPDLLGGRERELSELRRLLQLPIPILGIHAPSGAGKTSLLAAGLVPQLDAEGRPVAFDRHPREPGLARRLIGDLLRAEGSEASLLEVAGDDPRAFVECLLAVRRLSGRPPLLILDQLEELLRPASTRPRALVGALLAAAVQRQPGLDGLPCSWLLAYRQEYHGELVAWLRDVLAEAEAELGSAAKDLPHDLSTPDRFHSWPLPPLGTPAPRADPVAEATRAFRAAVEAPLALTRPDGSPRYPWRFAGDGAARLARAFGEARAAQPGAPLTPELQVVLAQLLTEAPEPEGGGPIVIRVPDDPGRLIERALEGQLRRALDAAFPGVRSARSMEARARALLALRELADTEGRRRDGIRADDLARAIGGGGTEILEKLSMPLTRLIVAQQHPDGWHYVLSHDRMAEVIVRVVEDEARHGELAVDREILALRRFVALDTELHRLGDPQATRMPRDRFRCIADHEDALLWGRDQRAWWSACRARRRADRWRLAGWSLVALLALAVVTAAVLWVAHRGARAAELELIATGDPGPALVTLHRLLRREQADREVLRARLSERQRLASLFEDGPAGVDAGQRPAVVLSAVETALPLPEERAADPQTVAVMAWALDYFPGRDAALAARARRARDELLAPLRARRPPPPSPGPGDPDWADLPAGSFHMGFASEAELPPNYEDDGPRHRVTLSRFRMLTHEVTSREYRRLFAEHPGEDELPAVQMSWYEAYAYAAWLGGRLPTEAEWEYAALAGCAFDFCDRRGEAATLDEVGWHSGNSGRRLQPVGRLEPNPWGLVDMYGNAHEWAGDWYALYSGAPQTDPWGPPRGGERLVRGHSSLSEARDVRAAYRLKASPASKYVDQGFRVALPPR